MLEHKRIKELHDKAYEANQTTREQAADDLVFYWVTQWDDQLLNDSQLQYRGQFDIVRKAGRQILASLKQNPVQPDFKPKQESRTDDAEIMDGMYRAADRTLDSQEAYDFASQDAVICGYGAWELFTEYESDMVGDDYQKIKRRFIPEANNNCFFDPNARKLDRSDAKYVSILYQYTPDGYMDLVEELTGERPEEATIASFAFPQESYVFPWIADKDKVYVSCFYYREKVNDKIITFEDPFGSELMVRENQVNAVMDELIESGYNVKEERVTKSWQITKYIVSGKEIIKSYKVAGSHIPVIPVFGETSSIEGQCHYEGIVRLAKDPQRLRNFQMSYLADIVSQSPRNKPMFFPEQVQGFENMYSKNGADNNYPYTLINRKTEAGEDLPMGVAGQLPDQQIPAALAASIQLSREAVEDVANPALPQNLADPDISGKAVYALQSRLDQQNYQFQHNFKFAKRRDAEIWAGMASEIIDTPRTIMIETADGQTKQVQIMETIVDRQTGEAVVINDVTNMEMEVYAEIGQNYSTQKEQTRESLVAIAGGLDPNDPLRKIVTMKALEMMDGVHLDDVRKHIRKELLIMGIKEPETEEDMQIVQAAQQQQQPDANMVLAMAEATKGKADMLHEQRGLMKDKADIVLDRTKVQVSAFDAETKRNKVMIDAEQAGVSIENKSIEAEGKHLDNQMKQFELDERGFERDLEELDTDELVSMIGG